MSTEQLLHVSAYTAHLQPLFKTCHAEVVLSDGYGFNALVRLLAIALPQSPIAPWLFRWRFRSSVSSGPRT